MKNTAIFKIVLLILALCLVAGSVFGVYTSISALGKSGNMLAQPSTGAQDDLEHIPPETKIEYIDGKPSVAWIFPYTSPGQHAQEDLDKLAMDLMITQLMQSDFLNYFYWADSQEDYERYLRNDPLLTKILQCEDGPAALMDYYEQHRYEDFKATAALESLFLSATFLEAFDPETYDRLFPD